MATKISSWIFLWICCGMGPSVALEKKFVKMSETGCFETGELEITNEQTYTLYADYRPNQKPSLDHCDVGIRAVDSGRRLEYVINKLTIFDCGISLWIYDNPQLVSQPTREIKCGDDKKLPIRGKTSHQVIKISLRKESTQAQAFDFEIHVKTDYGPPFDFEDSSTFYEDPLDTGAIVGIVIACSIFLIAVAGLAIYCCLKARMNNQRKHAEASEAQSAPSVYSSGTSRILYPASHPIHRGGGHSRSALQDSGEKVSSKHKTNVDSNNFHPPSKGINSHTSNKDDLYTNKNNRVYANDSYKTPEKLDRQASLRGSQKRRQPSAPSDDADYTHVKGGHISRRDSSRGSRNHVRYDKKTHYSRNDDYSSIGKGKKQPMNGHWRSRSRSPSVGSTVDSNTLVYGYSHSAADHPSANQDPRPRSRSGSRSRSRTRAGSQRSGSVSRSRTGSIGRSDARGRSDVRDGGHRTVPKNSRQYGDMSEFLPEQQRHHRSRSHSGSRSRRSHQHSYC